MRPEREARDAARWVQGRRGTRTRSAAANLATCCPNLPRGWWNAVGRWAEAAEEGGDPKLARVATLDRAALTLEGLDTETEGRPTAWLLITTIWQHVQSVLRGVCSAAEWPGKR